MGNTIEEIATLVADWWANTLVDPKFDNGEIGLGTVLAKCAVKDIGDRQLIEFKGKLGQYVVDKLTELSSPDDTIILSCDYGPDRTLTEIASHCLINESNFPWKTVMWIGKDFCQVRYGYSGRITYLYVTEERLQRRIKSAETSLQYYETQDDEYFEQWSSFSKTEIIEDAKRELDIAKHNLENFKNGVPVSELKVH